MPIMVGEVLLYWRWLETFENLHYFYCNKVFVVNATLRVDFLVRLA